MTGDRRDEQDTPADARRNLRETLAAFLPWKLASRIRKGEETLERVERSLVARADRIEHRLDEIEHRLDRLGEEIGAGLRRQDDAESAVRALQTVVEEFGNVRLTAVDRRLENLEVSAGKSDSEIARLRDGVIPASEGRWNALFERLTFELEETASLVERMLASEPLPVIGEGSDSEALAKGLSRVQPLLVEAFRGSEAEISRRMESILPILSGHAPVLDLGCGRGELLLLLREAGIESKGVDGDVALVQGAVRRGLDVVQGDVLGFLQGLDDHSVGAITAFHFFEHCSGIMIVEILDQCRRVLRPGGLVVAELPNPRNLRVGASLFWLDPTHRRPILPETMGMFFKAAGFEIRDLLELHPFPEDQRFESRTGGEEDLHEAGRRLVELERRLDQLLNGPRDFRIIGVKSKI